MAKKHVCLIFGGRSAEHEVSLESALSIIEKIDQQRFELTTVGIDKNGTWLYFDQEPIVNPHNPKTIQLNSNGKEIYCNLNPKSSFLELADANQQLKRPDIIFPMLHGTYGEDGRIQGLFEMAQIAYVGAGVLGSAAAMDKVIAKKLMCDAKIPVAPFLVVENNQEKTSWLTASTTLGNDIFIKPANLGSSVGVARVQDENSYNQALDNALSYDDKVLLEKRMLGREIECAVLGNRTYRTSLPGEVIPNHDFYSYEAKYVDPQGAQLVMPAKLSKTAVEKVQHYAATACRSLDVHGLARVDLFYNDKEESYVVNEVNTMPGFTASISMYPKLWQVSGLEFTDLLDELFSLGMQAFERRQTFTTNYSLG